MVESFSALEPLARRTLLVEASAGTGKTYSITSLYLRLVAEEGIPVDGILVVTFTRAATAELRSRLRARLSDALQQGAALLDGAQEPPADGVFAHVFGNAVDGQWQPLEAAALKERLQRLRAALVDFDSAPINTIHGFCQDVLRTYGFEGGQGLDLEFLEDASTLQAEVVDDFMSRHACEPGDGNAPDRKVLLELARKLTANPAVEILPATGASAAEWEHALANARDAWGSDGERRFADECSAARANGYFKPKQTTWGRANAGHPYSAGAKMVAQLATALAGGRAADYCRCDLLDPGPEKQAAHEGEPFPSQILPALRAALPVAIARADSPIAEFVAWARAELPRRKQVRRQQTFDDLLLQLRAAVEADGEDGPLVQGLRKRYRAALIDEFQDTDPVQWGVFEKLFGKGHYLYLVGDPKQAIYAFRGADVFVYRQAAAATPDQRTMEVNHRSDGRLLRGLNAFMGGRGPVFEVNGIDYTEVKHADKRKPWDAFAGSPGTVPPLVIRWFDPDVLGVPSDDNLVGAPDGPVAELLGADVESFLKAGATITEHGKEPRSVRPRDVAVLTRDNQQARAVQQQLSRRGIVAVLSAQESVFVSDEAGWLLRWLDAVADHTQERNARALALTPLVGWDAATLKRTLDSEPAAWAALVHGVELAGRRLASKGVARAFDQFAQDWRVAERLAGRSDGERALTNLRHLAELLHGAEAELRAGATSLARWLRDRAAQAEARVEGAEGQPVRMESDEDAVLVTTVHKSKGLEYPVTFLPFLWNGRLLRGVSKDVFPFHRVTEDGSRLVLDARVASKCAPGRDDNKAAAETEVLQENLRLLYVALTRAKHRAVVYWGPTGDAGKSPLGVLLHGGNDASAAPGARSRVARAALKKDLQGAECSRAVVAELAERSKALGGNPDTEPAIHWEAAALKAVDAGNAMRPLPPPAGACDDLAERQFQGVRAASGWSRTSYTALAARHGHKAAPVNHDGQDHDGNAVDDIDGGQPGATAAFPWDGLKGGNCLGNLVHGVLERLDFQTRVDTKDGTRGLEELVQVMGRRTGFTNPVEQKRVAALIPTVLDTPLGPRAGSVALKDIGRGDRLSEMTFELSIQGGTTWTKGGPVVSPEALQGLLGRARPDADIPETYLAEMRAGSLKLPPLAGFLTGSLDLVYRASVEGRQRWFVADYKSNRAWLPAAADPSTPSGVQDYSRPSLALQMAKNNYFVQYYLYLVALHRFLRQRLRAYDYDTHVGGAVYLFVRGMTGVGPGASEPAGVFFDRPPRHVIEGLDGLFAGGAA